MVLNFHSEFNLLALRTRNAFLGTFVNMLLKFWRKELDWFLTLIRTRKPGIAEVLKVVIELVIVEILLTSKLLIGTVEFQRVQLLFVELVNFARLMGEPLAAIDFITAIVNFLCTNLTNDVLAVQTLHWIHNYVLAFGTYDILVHFR